MRAHRLLIPLTAALAILPLLLLGSSCGHDFDFHLLSWYEAFHQLAHAQYPHWASAPAFHAGEPRFIFYPPLSWLLGALLTALLPFHLVPAVFTFACLTLSGSTMYRLARRFSSPAAATLAAVAYQLGPYSLFTAYERTAFAELLAAAWIPLLFGGILRRSPTVPGIAVPVALLWLTNAPAAVMSMYALALLAAMRILTSLFYRTSLRALWLGVARPTVLGTALGLMLPGFYLLPAAYERRWVEIGMAVIDGLRPADNWLFHKTGDPAHDAVLHTASVIAVCLLSVAVVALGLASGQSSGLKKRPDLRLEGFLLPALLALTAAIAFLLTPWSAPLWNHLPELSFLQFPWRTLALLSAAAALGLALVLRSLVLRPATLAGLSVLLALALVYPVHAVPGRPRFTPVYFESCDPGEEPEPGHELPDTFAQTLPTDEYTPEGADNDALQPGDPAWWLIPAGKAPDTPAPAGQASAGAPDRLTLDLASPETLVLNRRFYPAWQVTVNGRTEPQGTDRNDGLIMVPLQPGVNYVVLTFITTRDRIAGGLVSLFGLLGFGLAFASQKASARGEDTRQRP